MATNLTLPDRVPYEPAAIFVQRVLRSAIISRVLRPGEMLSEQEIADQFGISRQPVREAFIKLSEAGLVRVLPQRGTQVAKISLHAFENARFIREAVETAIAAEAALHIGSDGARALDRHLERQAEAMARDNRDGFFFLDEAFHAELAVIARRQEASRFLEAVKSQMDRARFLALQQMSPLDILISQHTAIADAVKAGDPAAASAAMAAHLKNILGELAQLQQSHEDLFEGTASPK